MSPKIAGKKRTKRELYNGYRRLAYSQKKTQPLWAKGKEKLTDPENPPKIKKRKSKKKFDKDRHTEDPTNLLWEVRSCRREGAMGLKKGGHTPRTIGRISNQRNCTKRKKKINMRRKNRLPCGCQWRNNFSG